MSISGSCANPDQLCGENVGSEMRLRWLFEFNHCVNQGLFDVVERVPAKRLRESIIWSFGTIHDPLNNILRSDRRVGSVRRGV